jgi:hypothetical protein
MPPSLRRFHDHVINPRNLQCSNNRTRIKAGRPWSCIVSAQTPTECVIEGTIAPE